MDRDEAEKLVDYLINKSKDNHTSLYDKLYAYRNTLVLMLVNKKVKD